MKVTSPGALPTEDVLHNGVRADPEINAIATRADHEIAILLWNYHDEDLPVPPSPIDLTITGLPSTATRGLLEHFRIDARHSNSFAAWSQMGSPQTPSAEEYERLQAAGQLQLLNSPAWIPIANGDAHFSFPLPRQSVSLLLIRWK